MIKNIPAAILGSLLLFFPVLAGCGVPAAVTVPTSKIVAETLAAQKDVSTVKINYLVTVEQGNAGDADTIPMNVTETGAGSISLPAREMRLDRTLVYETPSFAALGSGKVEYRYSHFVTGGWEYVLEKSAGVPDSWTKSEMDNDLWAASNPLTLVGELVSNPSLVNKVTGENFEGKKCYVLEIKPDATFLAPVAQLIRDIGSDGTGWKETDFDKLFSEFEVKAWVTQSDFRFVKVEVILVGSPPAQTVPSAAAPSPAFTINIMYAFSGYDTPVAVTLPPAAFTAKAAPSFP
jgi:hypothetical protein